MALKSIVDIDVRDEKFRAFQALFEKYQTQLQKSPVFWQAVSKEQKPIADAFSRMTAALMAQKELARDVANSQKHASRHVGAMASAWQDVSKSTGKVAHNIAEATRNLIRWTGITTIATGILGFGGMFGMTRLAEAAAMGRRSAIGLGTTYGRETAFNLNFGRFVNTGSFLSGISQAMANPAMATPLYALGLNGAQLQGDTSQVAVRTLQRLRQRLQTTPDQLLGTYLDAYQLGNIGLSVEDLRRLKHMNGAEFSQQMSAFRKDRGALGLSDPMLKSWQDFVTQMSRAGKTIDKVFITGLTPLVGPLTKLSGAFADVLKALLGTHGGLAPLITSLSVSLEEFARYVATPQFHRDVQQFGADFDLVCQKIVAGLKYLGVIPDQTTAGPQQEGGFSVPGGQVRIFKDNRSVWQRMLHPLTPKDLPLNNPLNLRVPGSYSFRQFSSMDSGIAAAAAQLRRDENVHGLSTIRQIISDSKWGWAPASDGNNVRAYIKDIVARTGYGADQRLNLNDNATLAQLVSAMAKHESNASIPARAVVTVLNNTGGNAIVSVNQLAQ